MKLAVLHQQVQHNRKGRYEPLTLMGKCGNQKLKVLVQYHFETSIRSEICSKL